MTNDKRPENSDSSTKDPERNTGTKPLRDAKGYWLKGQSGNPKGAYAPPVPEFIIYRKNAHRMIREYMTDEKILSMLSSIYTTALAGDFRSLKLLAELSCGVQKATDPRETESGVNLNLDDLEGALSAIAQGISSGAMPAEQAKSLIAVLQTLHQVRDTSSLSAKIEGLRDLLENRKHG